MTPASSDPPPEKERRFDSLLEAAIETEYETGRREETLEEAKRHIVLRVANVVGGLLVVMVGIAMLVLPGPGIAVILIGLALLAPEIPFADRLMENLKSRLPQDEAGGVDKRVIVFSVITFVVFTGVSIYFGIQKFTE